MPEAAADTPICTGGRDPTVMLPTRFSVREPELTAVRTRSRDFLKSSSRRLDPADPARATPVFPSRRLASGSRKSGCQYLRDNMPGMFSMDGSSYLKHFPCAHQEAFP